MAFDLEKRKKFIQAKVVNQHSAMRAFNYPFTDSNPR